MEALLAGKSRSVAVGALRALVVPLREHWGDPAGFQQAALPVLASEAGGALYNEKESPAHLDQIYRQVQRARATYFRPVENLSRLELLFKELDLTAAKASSPLQQGVLWLASRLQQQAIAFLQKPQAQQQIDQVLAAVAAERTALTRALGPPEQLLPDRVEAALSQLAQRVLQDALGAFELTALAGHLFERVRQAARRPRKLEVSQDEAPRNDAMTALLATLLEPVRQAEINEARARYARLSEEEKTRRFNEFRRVLLRVAAEVAPFAPDGLEAFCAAIEARLYPYPEPMQFIRSFARPIWTNGAQSGIFANVTTPQGVESTYEQMAKARQGNPVVLEIAKAFALRNFRQAAGSEKSAVLKDLNLKAEFGWPTTVAELKSVL